MLKLQGLLPKEYQTKQCTFLRRKFFIGRRVHIPRKNTEPLATLALQYIERRKRKMNCADIGTGAGVLAISLALGSKLVKKVFATDIYAGAIWVARRNIKKFHVDKRIILKRGDLLWPIRNEKVNLIVADLPHASTKKFREKPYLALEHRRATLAGKTGLEIIRLFLKQLVQYPIGKEVSAIFLKIPPGKAKATIRFVHHYIPSYKLETRRDEKGKTRYLIALKRL